MARARAARLAVPAIADGERVVAFALGVHDRERLRHAEVVVERRGELPGQRVARLAVPAARAACWSPGRRSRGGADLAARITKPSIPR